MQKKSFKRSRAVASIIIGITISLSCLAFVTSSHASKPAISSSVVVPSSSSTVHYLATGGGATGGGIYITMNRTWADRMNRAVNISVNANGMLTTNGGPSGWISLAPTCNLNITYPNNTVHTFDYNMTEYGNTNTFFTIFKTTLNMQPGIYQFMPIPLRYDSKNWTAFTLDSSHPAELNVTSTPPFCQVLTNSSLVYTNQSIAVSFSFGDESDPTYNITWTAYLFDNESVSNTRITVASWQTGDDLNQTVTMYATNNPDAPTGNNATGVNSVYGECWFNLTVYNSDGQRNSANSTTFYFESRPPTINSVTPEVIGTIYRVTQTENFTVNATDTDYPSNWLKNVSVTFQYPNGLVNYTTTMSQQKFFGNYTANVTLPATFQLGYTVIYIVAQNLERGITYITYHHSVDVIDAIPIVHSLSINNQTITNGMHIQQDQELVFFANVTSVENNIEYVNLTLRADTGQALCFFLTPNTDPALNYTLYISSAQLSTGIWHVYVVAVDSDGGMSNNVPDTGSFGVIVIDPNLTGFTTAGTIIVLMIALGFIIGAVVMFRYANQKVRSVRTEMIIKAKKGADDEGIKGSKTGAKGSQGKQSSKQKSSYR
jgi:hypothetical protein